MKRFHKLTAWLLTLAMLMTFIPSFTLGVSAADETPTEKNITLGTTALKGGQASNVYFGTYQQSSLGNTEPADGTEGVDWIKSTTATKNSQGRYYKKDPIKWRVLSNADEKAFLLSDKNLDVVQYHTEKEAVTWETSTIRSWLNGYDATSNQNSVDYSNDNFINAAFGVAEKGVIADTTVVNDDNPSYNTEGGNDTTDKVFLLSIAEAQNTAYGFTNTTGSTDTRKAVNTAYVYGGGKNGASGMYGVGEADYWWLRSPGNDTPYAAYVRIRGDVHYIGFYVHFNSHAVRPAFNLNLSSVLFTSAASGSKPTGTGLTATTAYTGNEYKLTLKDNTRNFALTDTSAKTAQSGETLSLGYTGATTGTNEYISAMIVGTSGEVIYYGQLAQPTAESGTVDLTIPSDIAIGEYTLKIFNEQINGDYKTDYSSAFVNIPLTVTNLILHTNGGTINSGNLEYYTEGEATTLPTDITKNGHAFMGWYENAEFTGDKVTEIAATETGNKEYFAKWLEKVTFKVENTEHIYQQDTVRQITVTPESISNTLTKDNFTVKYYEVDENNDLLTTTPVAKAITSGKYLYVIDFAEEQSNYAIEKKYEVTDTTLPDISAYDNIGYMYINATAEQQEPIYFESSVVNAYVTDGTVENKLVTNDTNGEITYESKNTSVAVFNNGVLEIKGAGTTVITATSRVTGKASTSASYTLNVSKKPVTITAKAASVTYGSEWDKASATVEYSDNLTIDYFDGTLDFETDYDKGDDVGSYTITPKGLTSDKYEISFISAKLTAEPLTLTADNFNVSASDKHYDGTDAATVTAEISGLYGTDIVKAEISGAFDGADVKTENNAVTKKNVNYTISDLSGKDKDNYILENGEIKGTVQATIKKAVVTIICAETTTRTYDGNAQTVDVSAMANGAVFDKSNYKVKYNNADTATEVNDYTITVELINGTDKNYEVAEFNAILKIVSATQEVFSVEGVPETVYYGDTFTVDTYGENENATVTYEISNGADVASIDGANGAVTIKGVGKVTIRATSTLTGHSTRYATKTFEVKKKVLTPTATATDRAYNGKNGVEVVISFGKDEIIYDNEVSATGIGTMVNADVGTDKIVYVSGITLDGEHKDLYTLSTTSVQTTVDIKPIEITDFKIEAETRKYDTTTTAQATITEISGILDSDKGQVEIVGSAEFDTADSDKDKTVTFTATGLSGTKAANYTLSVTKATATANIEPLSVDFVIGIKTFVYDGEDKEITVSASDENGKIFKGYTIEYTDESGDITTPNAAGTYTATIKLNDTINYTTDQEAETLEIAQAAQDQLVIVGLPGTIQYGDSFTLEAVGGEDGGTYEWSITGENQNVTLNFEDENDKSKVNVTIGDVVGQKVEIVVKKSTVNYDDISAKVVFVPTAKAVSFDISKLEQTYGDISEVEVSAFDGLDEIELTENEDYTINYNGGELPENAGTYTVKVTATGKYTGTQTATLVISKATPNGDIKGINQTYTYGESVSAVYENITSGATAEITYAGTGIYVPQTDAPKNVGSYTAILTISGDNYETVTKTENFVIKKAPLKVWAENYSRAYGEANPIFEIVYDVADFKNGDTETVILSAPIASTKANASSPVGKYNITVSGGSAENYEFDYINDDTDELGVLEITGAKDGQLIITGATNTVNVGQTFTLHAFYGNSKVNVEWKSDNEAVATIDKSTGVVKTLKSGTVTFTATADGNYSGATAQFELNIEKANVLLSAKDNIKTYNGNVQHITLVSSNAGFIPVIEGEGKNIDITYTLITDSNVNEPKNVGTYAVSFIIDDESYSGNGNATLYINKANIELKPKDIEKVYGDEPTFELVTENTLITAEELATLTNGSTFTSEGKDKTAVVGEYDITAVLGTAASDNLNYTISGTGKLTVKKAPLTVKVKDVSREYGAENPTLEAEYTGFKNEETADVLTGELVLAYDESITAESAVGTYEDKTTASGLSSDNYDIKFENGNVTITKIPVTASKGTARSSYLTVKFDKALAGLTAANFVVKNGEEEITLTEVTASSDNKTYTLKGSFGASVTYTVTPNLTGTENDATHEITSEALSIKPSSGGSSGGGGGGGGGSSAPTTYTIKFETNGGSEIDSVKVTKNKTAEEPTAPTKDGYTFDGWYTDKELTKAYDFDTKVTKAITLYAKWTENKVDDTDDKTDDKTDTPDTPVWENPFTDVNADDWYYENARYAVENGLFNGTTETTFAPNEIITRAMMVTVLYRAEGEPTVTGTTTFEDVDSNAYYAKAVVWGQQNGIIKGYSETEFAPDQNITREQIAAIMHRYAQYKGYDVSVGENTNILSYDDFDSISEYAIASMQYAVGSGLMKGKTSSTLNPLDNATRAEIAAILHRFLKGNTDTMTPILLYQGHGSVRVETPEGKVIYIDPYAGEGYDLPADLILVTHGHGDHNKIELIEKQNDDCVIITHEESNLDGELQSFDLGYVKVEAVEAENKNHNIKECVGYILTFSNGKQVYFTGDTSTTNQMSTLAERKIDYAFYCCDGKFNMDRAEAAKCAELVGAKYNIPYHMAPGSNFDRAIAEEFDAPGRVILEDGQTLEIK